jgi:hypothetical protein
VRTLVILLLGASLGDAQTIATKLLTPSAPIKVELSPALTTTLLFPGAPSGTFGLGLVGQTNAQASNNGSVQIEHPDGSPVVVLHALSESASVLMTVLLDGQLYVFDLRSGPSPDVAVTLVKNDTNASRAVEVTPEDVKAARLKYDPELLVGFLRRARDSGLLRKLYPDLYDGYASRRAEYTSDSGSLKTTVTQIHRFSREDAIVLEGTVQNETSRPIQFDGRSATIQVANEMHPIKLLDCLRPIPAGATVPIDAVIQGDIDGGRANLSIDNEMRIILPAGTGGVATLWDVKNGRPVSKFTVQPPVDYAKLLIPREQTGKPTREGPKQ